MRRRPKLGPLDRLQSLRPSDRDASDGEWCRSEIVKSRRRRQCSGPAFWNRPADEGVEELSRQAEGEGRPIRDRTEGPLCRRGRGTGDNVLSRPERERVGIQGIQRLFKGICEVVRKPDRKVGSSAERPDLALPTVRLLL